MTSIGILLASMMIPAAILVASLLLIKWLQRRDGRRSPLSGKVFHQPGEQLRKRVADITDDIGEKVARVVFIGPLLLLAVVISHFDWSSIRFGWAEGVVVLMLLGFLLWNVRGLAHDMKRRNDAREGLAAELMTAQLLLPLMTQGCLVYHDIPADKFNLDHVVIGPNAVYMVETKSRRKPAGKGKDNATVHYDGTGLRFPDHATTQPIEQARHEARWLAEYLRAAAGEPVVVFAVVALPGWFVTLGKDASRSDVAVINPKMHSVFLDTRRGTPISNSLRNRIAHALSLRYPDVD